MNYIIRMSFCDQCWSDLHLFDCYGHMILITFNWLWVPAIYSKTCNFFFFFFLIKDLVIESTNSINTKRNQLVFWCDGKNNHYIADTISSNSIVSIIKKIKKIQLINIYYCQIMISPSPSPLSQCLICIFFFLQTYIYK